MRGGIKMPSSEELNKNNGPMLRAGNLPDSSLPKAVNYTKYMQPIKDQKGKKWNFWNHFP